MNKKMFEKDSFFKKEGFYIAIVVCLCVIAGMATYSIRKNVQLANQSQNTNAIGANNSTDENIASNDAKTGIDNATEVKDNSKQPEVASVKNPVETPTDKTNTNDSNDSNKTSSTSSNPAPAATASTDSVPASSTAALSFQNPVEGTIARPFSTKTVFCETIGTYKMSNGMDIKADLGAKVYAALDGKVETIDNDKTELGEYIVIDNGDGIKTYYGNLDEKTNVSVGDTVKKGTEIGTVGNTRGSYSKESYGSHLYFAVSKSGEFVDPAQYVNYK